jgi:hypothetical protein
MYARLLALVLSWACWATQVTSVTAASRFRMHSATHQCSGLAGHINSNAMASIHATAVCVGSRNFVLRVSVVVHPLAEAFVFACPIVVD